jgi:zinc transport system permease protein
MLTAILEYHFLQKALAACLLASIVCGVIGVIIIEKKLIMMCGGIAHTSYGGVGLGYLLGFEPIIGAFAFAVMAALGIGYINRKGSRNADIFNGLFWSLGMSLGILFIALMPGYPPDLSSYLFGSVLSVTTSEIILMLCLTAAVLLIVTILFDNWKTYLFDEEFASVTGVRTAFLEYLLLIMVAMAVVVLIRVVGIILILALLLAPAAAAGLLTNNLKKRMILAVVFGWVFSFAGLWISYEADIASGSVIVIISVLFYLLIYALTRSAGKLREKKQG